MNNNDASRIRRALIGQLRQAVNDEAKRHGTGGINISGCTSENCPCCQQKGGAR